MVVLAHEVLRAYGGTLTQQAPEGFTAVFGVPVAQEDHARRAVLAALDLLQRLAQHPTLRPPAWGQGSRSGSVSTRTWESWGNWGPSPTGRSR